MAVVHFVPLEKLTCFWLRLLSEKKAKCVEVEYDDEDEFSNICDSSESVKRRVRKTVNNQKLSLNLMCEWSGCKFTGTTIRSVFVQHVAHHIPDLAVLQKADETSKTYV